MEFYMAEFFMLMLELFFIMDGGQIDDILYKAGLKRSF